MTAGIIDESTIAEALRFSEPGERIKRLLSLQGLGLWRGDLAEMRGDSPRRHSEAPFEPAPGAREVVLRMAATRKVSQALDLLPIRAREALRLRYLEELPVPEVAKRLEMTIADTETLIRESLRESKDRFRKLYRQSIDKRDRS